MPHRVVLQVIPDFQLLDVAGPIGAFERADRAVGRRLPGGAGGRRPHPGGVEMSAGGFSPLPRAAPFSGGRPRDARDGARPRAP
jgi:hypothetical protein